jgi:hypothetical protein
MFAEQPLNRQVAGRREKITIESNGAEMPNILRAALADCSTGDDNVLETVIPVAVILRCILGQAWAGQQEGRETARNCVPRCEFDLPICHDCLRSFRTEEGKRNSQ